MLLTRDTLTMDKRAITGKRHFTRGVKKGDAYGQHFTQSELSGPLASNYRYKSILNVTNPQNFGCALAPPPPPSPRPFLSEPQYLQVSPPPFHPRKQLIYSLIVSSIRCCKRTNTVELTIDDIGCLIAFL